MAKKDYQVHREDEKAKEITELENRLKRALADYQNLEKRIEKEKESFICLANAQLLKKILPVLDELEICQKHIQDQGLAIVLEKFQQILFSEGVSEIKVEGEQFNPDSMEVVEIVRGPKNKVVEVVAKGYCLGERILRPAKVKVGKEEKKL